MAYVIAEVGQNHNGSVQLAKELIDMAADPRPAPLVDGEDRPLLAANAVKFTKRHLSEEGSRGMMAAEYRGRNSFGKTYGEHRAHLEFSFSELEELSRYTAETGLDFGLTVCHPKLVYRALKLPRINFLKIASRDLTNIPLIEELAAVDLPRSVSVIVSTGMASRQELETALEILRAVRPLIVMHCRSVYPCPPAAWDLQLIPTLRAMLPDDVAVGYSDHSIGVLAPALAAAFGADFIEKHVTLDRMMRGSDQLGSVEREGLYRMLRSIQEAEIGTWGNPGVHMSPLANPARSKLARSLHWSSSLNAGTEVEERHLCMISPGTGLPWSSAPRVIGKTVSRSVERHEAVDLDDLE